jgi:hypothetical protein
MAIFRLLSKRAVRVSLIVLLVGLIFGFGHFMTPRAPDAFAKVWLDVGDAMNSPGMPEYMKLNVDEGAVQEVYLNDNTLFYTLYRTEKSVPQLLDYYENLYSPDAKDRESLAPEGAKEAMLARTPKGQRDEALQQIEETEDILNDKFVRFEGKGWGGFATIYNGDENEPDWHNRMTERIRQYKQTGMVAELGSPKIVVAFEDPAEDNTQYFNVWPASDFDGRKVRPKGEQDAPGYDISDIQRPWGSQRMITFGQNHGGVSYSILVYRGAGQTDDVFEHFMSEMAADGWAVSARFAEARALQEDPEPSMLFIKEGKEAYVGLRSLEVEGQVTSTVIVYDRGA